MIDLTGIISISGMPGLYKVMAQTKNGVIVESLIDKKRFPVYGSQRISALDDIAMFTSGDDKPIPEIITSIFEKTKGEKCIDNKADDKTVVDFFMEILPDYDKERVYISNMRKLFSWYNLLQETDNLKEKTEGEESKEGKSIIKDDKAKVSKSVNKNIERPAKQSSAGHKKAASVRKTGAS
jgi:hypothetical protein